MVINIYEELHAYVSDNTIGGRIKKQRLLKGLSQEALANLSGLTRPAINNYELNAVYPPPRSLKKLSDALNVSVEYFDDSDYCKFILSDYPSIIKKWRSDNGGYVQQNF